MISTKKLMYRIVTKIRGMDTNVTTLLNGGRKVGRVGAIEGAAFSDKNLASGSSWVNLGSITLGDGIWIVFLSVDFASNANGYRQVTLSTASNTGGGNLRTVRTHATSGADTGILFSCGVTGGTKYYLNALQNSGATLKVESRYTCLKIGGSWAS